MADLLLGPLLRHVDEDSATIWVETDTACEVEILGRRVHTFEVEGHHYALVLLYDLERCARIPYEVHLNGERRWPEPGAQFPDSIIRTLDPAARLTIAFGSCHVSAPHEPPYTLRKDEDSRGREIGALYALAHDMAHRDPEDWPQVLLLLGDQVYADELSPGARAVIDRRDESERNGAPRDEAADYQEYAQLYWDTWRDATQRWLMSVVPTAMIFDDHDVHDDWNTSEVWRDQIQRTSWWEGRIEAAFMSYWVYQHIGNLAPEELERDELFRRVRELEDAGDVLREMARSADRRPDSMRWSFHRDIGRTRLVMIDSRAGRVLDGERKMVDDAEWQWISEQATGDVDHLLLGTSLPYLLAPGMHHLEAWNEAVCDGAWGARIAGLGEKLRQALDLEHWAAFRSSFHAFTELLAEIGSGRRGQAPASIIVLSGDVHHAYLARTAFRRSQGVRSAVYQAVCSPFRNPLDARERRVIRAAASRPAHALFRLLARAAGVEDPDIRWRFDDEPIFHNQVATLELHGRSARLRFDRTKPGELPDPTLHAVTERELV